MKAIVRYGQAFGGYTMRDVPEPTWRFWVFVVNNDTCNDR